MATRSTIARHMPNGTVEQVYCHWDGYLTGNGRILLKHYSDPVKLQQLLDLGDLSVLGPEIGEKHDFDFPPNDVCTFYGRDRGEENTWKTVHATLAEYFTWGGREQFNYLYTLDGKWLVRSYENDEPQPLDQALTLEILKQD